MLSDFYITREEVRDGRLDRPTRRIRGTLVVHADALARLQSLHDKGYLSAEHHIIGVIDFVLHAGRLSGETVIVELNPLNLHYYEDADELVSYALEEPQHYYVHGFGELRGGEVAPNIIENFRGMLAAKLLLNETADLPSADKAIFLTPDTLEIPFRCGAADLRLLPGLGQTREELSTDAVEREQRLQIFKRSLGDHLRMHPVQQRFARFMDLFPSIEDSYRRDFGLWIGNTFADIKRNFEEKRLKFIADLNGILAAVQASILAVPIATILMADKFDLSNPAKNFVLAAAVAVIAGVAFMLLKNQSHTLEATTASINAVREDYEKRQPAGNQEFTTRLEGVIRQRIRVERLLAAFNAIVCALPVGAGVFWLVSFILWLCRMP